MPKIEAKETPLPSRGGQKSALDFISSRRRSLPARIRCPDARICATSRQIVSFQNRLAHRAAKKLTGAFESRTAADLPSYQQRLSVLFPSPTACVIGAPAGSRSGWKAGVCCYSSNMTSQHLPGAEAQL